MNECHVVFAGGSCGMTMISAGEKLAELCDSEGLQVNIHYMDLWVSDYLMPKIDLVVEMFPYFKNLSIPVFNGRPFLIRQGEDELLNEIIRAVGKINSQ